MQGSRNGHCDAPGTPPTQWPSNAQLVVFFVALAAAAWSILPALLQSVPHADNIEQLNWAHALQWGYLKHPPLPTWILHAAVLCLGPSAFLTYALAMGCVAATLLIVWRCALLFLDGGTAVCAVLLTSADYYLMGRGSFLNHNTVMLPFVAASAWAVLRILDPGPGPRRREWPIWVLLGLVQSLGLLTKYQMAIVIAANALALLALGAWRRPRFVLHAAICALATSLPLVPHVLWLEQHDFSTFAYAGHSLLAALPLGERLVHALGFVAQQVGRLAPALLAMALAIAIQRGRSPVHAAPARNETDGAEAVAHALTAQSLRVWLRALAILALTPLGVVLALTLFAGVAPQNHWGASTTVLLPLLGLAWLQPRLAPALRPHVPAAVAAALAVHAAAIGWNIVAAARAPGFHHSFAAQPLAAMALAHWQDNAAGSIEIVIGPDWEAGAIALALPTHPAVMASGDRAQAPWITDAQIARCGALVLWRPGQAPHEQVGADIAQRIAAPLLLETRVPGDIASAIEAGIIRPSGTGCPPGTLP